MRKIFFALSFLAFALILAGCKSNFNDNSRTVTIDGQKFNLQIAKTEQQRETGLMNQKNLEENSGMLFLFDQKTTQTFWMKNTLVPLQILFIDGCRVVDIQEMTVENDPSYPKNSYTSRSSVDKVIELNSKTVPDNIAGQSIQELCN
jgi:hypothetical protein